MSERKLVLSVTLKDCEVQHFRCGGAGGQHRDKTSNAARVIHRESGARGESQESRSQRINKRTAFIRMTQTPAFQLWMRKQLGQDAVEEVQRLELERRINRRVEKDMEPENLRWEYRADGGWERE